MLWTACVCEPRPSRAYTENCICSFAHRPPRTASPSKGIRRQAVRRILPRPPLPRKSAISTGSSLKRRRRKRANLKTTPRARQPRRLCPCPRPNRRRHRSVPPNCPRPPGHPKPPGCSRPPDRLRPPGCPRPPATWTACACVRRSRPVSYTRRRGWWPTISSVSTLLTNTCP